MLPLLRIPYIVLQALVPCGVVHFRNAIAVGLEGATHVVNRHHVSGVVVGGAGGEPDAALGYAHEEVVRVSEAGAGVAEDITRPHDGAA